MKYAESVNLWRQMADVRLPGAGGVSVTDDGTRSPFGVTEMSYH